MAKRRSLNIRADNDTYDQLKALAAFTGLTRSEILRTLVNVAYANHCKKEQLKEPHREQS